MATALRHDSDRPQLDLSRPVSLEAVISSLAIVRWELDHLISILQSRSASRSVRRHAREVPAEKIGEVVEWEAKMARGDRPAQDPADLLDRRLHTHR